MFKLIIFFLLFTINLDKCFSQDFPTKNIRIITAAVSGGSDLISRTLVEDLNRKTKKQFIIENYGGGGGIIAIENASKSIPDGHTILITNNNLWTLLLENKIDIKTSTNFIPLSNLGQTSLALVIHPILPIKNLENFLVFVKNSPHELNYSASETGSQSYIAMEFFKKVSKINLNHIPYKGNPAALLSIITGETLMMMSPIPLTMEHIKSKRLKAIAVTSKHKSIFLPNLPTISSIFPDYESVIVYGAYIHKETPENVINILKHIITESIKTENVRSKLLNIGVEENKRDLNEFRNYEMSIIKGMRGI